jgi:hypothetical protein
MFSLLGSLLGFGTSFLPKVMDYFQDKQDKKHELSAYGQATGAANPDRKPEARHGPR